MNYSKRACEVLKRLAMREDCLFLGPFVLISDKSGGVAVKLEVHCQANGLYLAFIENRKKTGGHGRRVLNTLIELAQEFGCPIRGEIDDNFGRTRKQLRAFYKGLGAKFDGDEFIFEGRSK